MVFEKYVKEEVEGTGGWLEEFFRVVVRGVSLSKPGKSGRIHF